MCGVPLARFEGNNPDPLASSDLDCCDNCNGTLVIPARIRLIYEMAREKKISKEGRQIAALLKF